MGLLVRGVILVMLVVIGLREGRRRALGAAALVVAAAWTAELVPASWIAPGVVPWAAACLAAIGLVLYNLGRGNIGRF